MSGEYAASIPASIIKRFDRTIINYRSKERDKEIARNLSNIRTIGPAFQTDVVTYWEKTGGNDVIRASIKAKGAAADTVGAKENEVSHQMYKLTVGFNFNTRDLDLDPAQYTRKVEICTREIRRLEDYLFINGSTGPALTGMVTAARANPNGKIAAYGASSSSPNKDSIGNWAGTDSKLDIYTDILDACTRIGDNFEPMYLVGQRATIAPIQKLDDLRNKYADQILDLFGAGSTADFVRTSAFVPAGYAYVVAKDVEFAEFVISTDLRTKAYAEQPGEVIPVELIEWVNPNEFHTNEGVVEINTA